MDGLMMDCPLLVRHIAERAEAVFGDREVVCAHPGRHRALHLRAGRRARAAARQRAARAGHRPGDRVATFGWNSLRHLELYLAAPSMGGVLHTLNIRLFEDDLRYIVDHAEDQ